MNFNATLFGQFAFVLCIACAIVGYVLGKRKTESPTLMAVLGFIFGLIPPLGPIFILVLALKKDLPKTKENEVVTSDV